MKRRDLMLLLLGGAMTAAPTLRAQQKAMPVIGFLSSLSASDQTKITAAFRQGLHDAGYVEGENVVIDYRWAEAQYNQLPAMAAELVRHRVAVIAAISGTPAVLAAKAATATIPIVFAVGADPVAVGLVNSLNRPGGNITGATFFASELTEKRLELLRELVPKATMIVQFENTINPNSASQSTRLQAAAQVVGQQITLRSVTTESDIDAAFAAIAQHPVDALYVGADAFFVNHRDKLVALAARAAMPAIYAEREIVEAGGLISYGASRTDAYRLAGNYVSRILNGAKPADLPVQQPTKFELVVNLNTAKALGLMVPPSILARADEVIE